MASFAPIRQRSRTNGRLSRDEGLALGQALRAAISGEVRFDPGSRALYSTDASNYRQVPIGVVIPRTVDDAIAAVAIAREHGVPVLSRGGGTSLAGQTCNVALVIDWSKYVNHVLEVDPARRLARVEPGTILDDLRDAAERHHLTYGPDPATHNRCTLGGMIGNNSCGVHSIMAGKTDNNVERLQILTYDGLRLDVGATGDDELAAIIQAGGRRGEIYARLRDLRDRYGSLIRERFPDIPRRVSGYGLEQLLPENGFQVARALVGTEGTCVTVLEAILRLVASPPGRVILLLAYPDAGAAGDAVPEVMRHHPIGLEGFDDRLVRDMRINHLMLDDVALLPEPDAGAWLLVEFGGQDRDDASAQARAAQDALKQSARPLASALIDDPGQTARIWRVREAALGATTIVPGRGQAWPGWEDSAVPPDKVGSYLRDLRSLMERYGYEGSFYGHFGHGCVHTRMTYDLESATGIAQFRAFMEDAADLVLRFGGSLSGEHGDGQARAELLPKMYGPELVRAFAEFKGIWDPDNRMNPGKVVAPARMDEHLRLGTSYRPPRTKTHFTFPNDGGSFARATLRCGGVGLCRRLDHGTMCPSFMVTREEKDSTRGRARLLFEMLEGDPLGDGWRDEHVKDALDLCLACKGCKGDCPITVDMATYKAEFLSHYYAGRLRPPSAYAMGLIFWWARIAAHAPGLANALTHAPGLGRLAKTLAGVAPERSIPSFAPRTFVDWFRARPPRNVDRPPVLLWPDTFNNHFHPETAQAAVEVLEAAGFQVVLPRVWLCCGRPLYDYGMLDLAERFLRRILDELRPLIEQGVPVVGLEPSCLAVFRDELLNLFPNDADARRLSRQSYLLSEFLEQRAPEYIPPALQRRAIVHGHCHHKAVMGMSAETAVLDKLHLDYQVLDSGCCGMAGAFGFEKGDHYRVAVAAGERVLLPAVRAADPDTVIIADGFSCREQIEQLTDRRALHLAQVLQMALHEGPSGPRHGPPERGYSSAPARAGGRETALAGAGALALLGGVAGWAVRRRRR